MNVRAGGARILDRSTRGSGGRGRRGLARAVGRDPARVFGRERFALVRLGMTFRPEFVPAPAAEFPSDNPALHRGVSWVCLAVTGSARAVARPAPPPPSAARAGAARSRPARVLAKKAEMTHLRVRPPVCASRAPAAVEWSLPADAAWDEEVASVVEAWLSEPESDGASVAAQVAPAPGAPPVSDRPGLAKVRPAEPPLPGPVEARLPAPPVARAIVRAVEVAPPQGSGEAPDGYTVFVQALVEVALAGGATRAAAVLPRLMAGDPVDSKLLDDAAVQTLLSANIVCRDGTMLRATGDFGQIARAWRDVLCGSSEDLSACGTSTLDDWAARVLDALGVQARSGDARRELRRHGVAAFGMRVAA